MSDRLLRLGAAALACAALGWDGGGTSVEVGYEHHSVPDELQVGSPWVKARAPLAAGLGVEAGYRADVISAASVDLVTQATAPYEETRHQAEAGLSWERHGDSAGLRYFYSAEPDYRGQTVFAEAGTEVIERTWRLRGHYALRLDEQGRAGGDPEAFEPITDHALGLSVSHAPTAFTELSGAVEGHLAAGALESPYRLVPIFLPRAKVRADALSLWVAESHPDERLRLAAAVQARHALSSHTFVTALYRYYRDDWGVQGHTGQASLVLPLWGGAWADVSGRYYLQGPAGFYRRRYEALRTETGSTWRYMTRDRRLGPLSTARGGLSLRWDPGPLGPLDGLRISLFSDAILVAYEDFEYIEARGPGGGAIKPYEGAWGLSLGASVLGSLR